jgi:allantoin racemase
MMSRRSVALVNPNTSAATTKTMVDIARACTHVPQWLEIEGLTVEAGEPLITSPLALDVAAAAVLDLAPKLKAYDAVIIAAFGDPGREALANALRPTPVFGIGESSMRAAHELSNGRFAVVQTIPGLNSSIRQMAESCGYGSSLKAVLAPETTDASELMADARATEESLATLVQRATETDGAQAVIIGGGPLALAARALAPRFDCLIVEPIPVTIARVASHLAPRVLYCHGLESGPRGFKVLEMGRQGLVVTAPDMQMSLFNILQKNSLVRSLLSPRALLTRWPSSWLSGAFDDSFAACVSVQREALHQSKGAFDVLVGSSWGGAVAAALLADGSSWLGPAVLLCPALFEKERRSGGSLDASLSADSIVAGLAAMPADRKARCLLVHGTADETVPVDDSRAIARATGIRLELVEGGSHGLSSIVRDGRLAQFILQCASDREAS